jgi:type I site-specific restriction-modification system R (restriction) subunit
MSLTESVVEEAALSWFEDLNYELAHAPHLAPREIAAERNSFVDVVLVGRLRDGIGRLNPSIPADAREEALRKVLRHDAPSLIGNNRVLHRMLRDGVSVEYRREDGSIAGDSVRLIDFDDPDANDWLAVNQFTVIEGQNNRRPDIVVFVNGLPIGIIELKIPEDTDKWLAAAYNQIQTYKEEIPSLMHYNEVTVISDGLEARIGSLTANQEWFKVWRTIEGEFDASKMALELETLVRGVFEKRRFLDLIRNFIVFEDDPDTGAVHKLMAGYHQFHAVKAAVDETIRATAKDRAAEVPGTYWAGKMQGGAEGDRRVGVIWHTQGSGKSLSMLFYAGCIIEEPAMENPTLVFLTDRNDLDDQLFGQFQRCHEILRQTPIQATTTEHLRELLTRASGGVVFTTIQKFAPLEPSPRPSPSGRGREHYRGGFDFAGLKKQARELRQNHTDAEAFLWELLRDRQLAGAKFRRQHQFGEYITDFFCKEAKLVVECDGAAHDTPERRRIDEKRDAYLASQGLTVLRFENSSVLSDPEAVLDQIEARLPSTSGRGVEGEGNGAFKVRNEPLSLRRNIVVIADEAHRSQYDLIDGLARNLRDSLPNASFIGFTGTPIEKTDANTRAVFGDYISIYDIQRAVADKATVPIYYESRVAKLGLNQSELPKIDEEFEAITEGEELTRKEKLKTKWAALEALVGNPKRIDLVAADLVQHYERRLEAMEGKAMIVCMSRRICVDMYNAIIKLRPEWACGPNDEDTGEGCVLKIVMTGSAEDGPDWQPHIRNKEKRRKLAARFKDSKVPFKIVIVRDMWLTGFDAPSLSTMYVDKPMRGHALMQAIARVNRVFRDKPGGLVVDYLGLADQLKQALAIYTQSGGKGSPSIDTAAATAVMLEKHEIACGIMHGFDWSNWCNGTPAQKLSLLPPAQEHILQQEKGKERFVQVVTELSQAFALCAGSEDALEIRDDIGFFQAVKAALAKPRGERKSSESLDFAVRQLVAKAIVPEGEIIDVFSAAGLKQPDISILSDQFLAEVRGLKYKNVAAELLAKLLGDEIKVRSKRNLVQGREFSEMLKKTLNAYHNRAIATQEVIEELIKLAKEMSAANQRGVDLGLNDDEVAFYDALAANNGAVEAMGKDELKVIAAELVTQVRKSVTIDWTLRESARAKIKVLVKRILRKHGYPPDLQDEATKLVLQQAELLCAEWTA